MSLQDSLGILAALVLIAAFYCQSQRRLRLMALLSSGLFLGYAALLESLPLLILGGLFAGINLMRLKGMRAGRAPTRATWQMDRDVQDRVRDIQAVSRYSSAGIEF
ncbi:YgjV family protein [uncultured Roseobacter sp.]|uniref:YgjV family protein n=1 Tax=uncultured Roseobacter sp. TaxID=114847 RepID=UPI00262AA9C6|nr:YgjV family protein [uncultured Roseobacter sp.]